MEETWRKLEKLIFEYINNILEDENIILKKLTTSSHDSGYDATWIIVPSNEFRMKNILMESKYRTTEKSLPMNDCAKAIIISFNIGADKLYIGTNIVFSPQALKEASKFKERSNLEIEFIDGFDLKEFIHNNKKSLLEKNFNETFLQNIINSTTNLKKQSFNNQDTVKLYNFDKKRHIIIDEVTKSFLFSACANIITGIEGIGKSIVCYQILRNLKKYAYVSSKIDLSLCTNTRTLYINILEAIWGVGIQEIISDENIDDYIDTLLSTSQNFSNINIPTAVKQILFCENEHYNEYQDVFLHLLLLYINEILSVHKNDIRLIIMFENINLASKDILCFLIAIVKILNKNNVRTLLEIRTPLLVPNLSPIDSNNIFNELKKISNLAPYNITEFDYEECIKLIKKEIDLGIDACNSLINVLCGNPFEIQCAIEILKKKSTEEIKYLNKLRHKELLNYWEKEQISINNVAISLINGLGDSSEYRKLFELTILFNGSINKELIEDIFGNVYILNLAEESSLYEFSIGVLHCKHLRYIEAMRKTSNKVINYYVAKKVLEYEKNNNIKYDPLIELELMYSVGDFQTIPYKLLEICNVLIFTHQYNDIINAIIRYFDNVELNLSNNKILETHIILLLKLLHCVSETHNENNKKYSIYYDKAEELIKTFNHKLYLNKYWVEYQLLIWDKFFTIGDYSTSFKISKDLYMNLNKIYSLFKTNFDCAGRVYTAYGLSNKSVISGKRAKEIFLEGTSKFPNSFYCKASLLSQEGNYYLKRNPKLALNKYRSLLETVKGKQYPYREVLHTRIDISMAYFLCGEFEKSEEWANNSIAIAEPIGIFSQKGRALNILACCYSIEKKYKIAKQYWEDSIELLSYSNAKIYCWRSQLNYATILLHENVNSEKAYQLLYEIYKFLKSTNYSKILNDCESVSHQSLLLILLYFHCGKKENLVEEILLDFQSSNLVKEYYALLTDVNWKKQFDSKVKCVDGIVYVMG